MTVDSVLDRKYYMFKRINNARILSLYSKKPMDFGGARLEGEGREQLIAGIFSVLEIQESAVSTSEATERYKKLLYDIDEHAEDYSFSRAVEYMNMSEAYFSRFFKRVSGMTFSMYLNHIRVNKALDLLRDRNMTMTEIAMHCGFDTIRNFNRVFKQITGYAPRELPDGYILNLRSNSGNDSDFDPTITTSELMTEL